MAEDKLIFPIGFDLEKGVKEAAADSDKFLKRIASAIEKHPISVKVQLDQKSGLSSTIKAETQRATKELTGLKKEMAEINRQWNALSASDRGGEVGARLMARYRELTQEAKGYTSTLAAAIRQEDRLARQREKSANAAAKAAQRTREYNDELKSQDGYLSRLIKRLAVYAGFSAIRSFLTGVREVTAEFELQRVSLGAIIQDQNRASQLFSEIKNFALKSPIKILDLTTYVKQVAAYRIETDKLFDTTKRLADVSVGLGVDMGRLVLAYGQVKAASYLRAAEIRQFTEAGIPMLELLSEKFTEIQGKAVSTEQVMDLVSKRAVSFSMVEEIFKDMTDAGGMFYNMQEKQAQTLFGMWSKLGDAAAVMYEEIGNTSWVNAGMKEGIGLLESMMRNWRLFAGEIRDLAIVFAIFKTASIAIKWMQVNTVAAAAAERQFAAAVQQEQAAIASGNVVLKARSAIMGKLAIWNQKAALSTNLLTVAWNKLKVAMVSWGPMLIIAGLSLLIEKMIYASQQARALGKELNRIEAEGAANIQKSIYNFQTLADTAVNAADGSRKQREALDELHRTYKDMIPVQDMTIKKLRAMKGNYEQLTIAIREYIAQQTLTTKVNTIIETTNKDIKDYTERLKEKLKEKYGYTDGNDGVTIRARLDFSEAQIKKALTGIEELARTTTLNTREIIQKAFKEYAGIDLTNNQIDVILGITKSFWNVDSAAEGLIGTYRSLKEQIEDVTSAMTDDVARFGVYADKYKAVQDELQKAIDEGLKTDEGDVIAQNTYLYDRKVANMQIKSDIEYLKSEMVAAGVEWKDEWAKVVNDVKNDTDELSFMNWDAINEAFRDAVAGENVSDAVVLLQRQATKIQNTYNGLVPSKDVIKAIQSKFKELTAGMKLSMDNVKQYIIDSDGDVEEYVKKLEGDLKDIAKQQNDIALIEKNREAGIGVGIYAPTDDDLKKLNSAEELIRAMLEYLSNYRKKSGRGGGSDPRLGILQEMVSTLKNINKEYEELEKKEGATKALADTQKVYADTFKNMQSLAKKYKFDLPDFGVPTDTKTLTKYLDAIRKQMKKLPKSDKAVLALQVDTDKIDIDAQQKKIEKQLKELADKISRTKTAKEFYDKILSQTGDVELAKSVSLSIYGDDGAKLFEQTVEQIKEVFKSGKADVVIDVDAAIDTTNQRINYKTLADIYEKYQNDIIKNNRDTAQKIISEGQKTAAANILTWQKELAKAKSFEEKRTDIIKTESERRANIIKSNLPQEVKQQQIALSYDKQGQDLAKLAVDEFKSSDDFIKVFQDLDRVSTQTLDRMKTRLQEMINTIKDTENVEGLKSLVESLDKINEERETRNPIEGIISSFKEYAQARKDYRTAEANEASARAAYEAEKVALDQAITDAVKEQEAAQARVNELEKQGTLETNEGVSAQLDLTAATTKVAQATEKRNKASQKVKNAEKATTDALDAEKAATVKLQKNVNAMADAFNSAASSIQTIADMMGVAEDSELGDIVNGLVSGLQNAATIMTTILAIAIAIQSACWWLLAIGAAVAAFTAIGSWISNSKVRKANEEIEKQQELLDQLEYSYGRLEKAAEKAFGGDYIKNFKDQQANLQAQITATERQLAAERSKGKKADDDKIKEYKESIRDLKDQIADMQGTLAEFFTDTDVTSAAKDFAQAWLDAYLSFENTTDVMKEKFNELIKSMIINSIMANLVQTILQPLFDEIEKRAKDGKLDERDITEIMAQIPTYVDAVDKSLQGGMEALKAAGFDINSLRDTTNALTGISRDIAGASEESINGVAAGINTANYYISYVPQIAQNVAAMCAIMEGNYTPVQSGPGVADIMALQNQSLTHLQAIDRHTAETVTECQKIAERCTAMAEDIHRVVVPKGTKGSYAVQTQIS
ncbi:MAG: tape measure protein [Bacteroides cellulosilyticus]|nr:tape measure protein [Bacteroides cellulosilyticus]